MSEDKRMISDEAELQELAKALQERGGLNAYVSFVAARTVLEAGYRRGQA